MPKDFLEQPLFWLDFGFELMNDDPLNVRNIIHEILLIQKKFYEKNLRNSQLIILQPVA